MDQTVSEHTLQEMQAYYRARANEYDEWFYRQGRFNRSKETNERWFAEADQVVAALEAYQITGDVLELAPGTGIWTERLIRTATTLTAVDASSEMIAINQAKVGKGNISYIQGNIFNWRPERSYDAVFFGFWISHVPRERLESFLKSVAGMLKPGGKIFFVDSRREESSMANDHQLPDEGQQIMTRKLNDGRTFEIVKIYYTPQELEKSCGEAGLQVKVQETENYFLFGSGIGS